MNSFLKVLTATDRSEDVDLGWQLSRYLRKLGVRNENNVRRAVHAFKNLTQANSIRRRQRVCEEIQPDPEGTGSLRRHGYIRLLPESLVGTDQLVVLLKRLWLERCGHSAFDPRMDWVDGTHKPFLCNCFVKDDFQKYPEITDWIFQDNMLAVATRYFGHVPVLAGTQLWWSPVNDTEQQSQLFHFDPEDERMLRVFLNVSDVTEAQGPLTFISAEDSARLADVYKTKSGRFTDQQVFNVVAPSEVKRLIGPAGDVNLFDPARCAHYGSRRCAADRLILMLHFSPVPVQKEASGWIPMIDEARYVDRELATLALPWRYRSPRK